MSHSKKKRQARVEAEAWELAEILDEVHEIDDEEEYNPSLDEIEAEQSEEEERFKREYPDAVKK
jgi:aminoglycoside phosphotransferase (APT) family kinase protein